MTEVFRARTAAARLLLEQLEDLEVQWEVTERSHIHNLLERRETLLCYRRELAYAAVNPARLSDRRSRPGRLLEEERKSAALSRLPDVDQQIRLLADEWQREHRGSALMYRGREVLELLCEDEEYDATPVLPAAAPPAPAGSRRLGLPGPRPPGANAAPAAASRGHEGPTRARAPARATVPPAQGAARPAGAASALQPRPARRPSSAGPSRSAGQPSAAETAVLLSTELEALAASGARQAAQPPLASRWRQLGSVLAKLREQDERVWHAAKRHDHHPAPAAYEQHQLLHTALRLAHALWPAALPTLGALGAEAFGRAVLALGQRTLDAT